MKGVLSRGREQGRRIHHRKALITNVALSLEPGEHGVGLTLKQMAAAFASLYTFHCGLPWEVGPTSRACIGQKAILQRRGTCQQSADSKYSVAEDGHTAF